MHAGCPVWVSVHAWVNGGNGWAGRQAGRQRLPGRRRLVQPNARASSFAQACAQHALTTPEPHPGPTQEGEKYIATRWIRATGFDHPRAGAGAEEVDEAEAYAEEGEGEEPVAYAEEEAEVSAAAAAVAATAAAAAAAADVAAVVLLLLPATPAAVAAPAASISRCPAACQPPRLLPRSIHHRHQQPTPAAPLLPCHLPFRQEPETYVEEVEEYEHADVAPAA